MHQNCCNFVSICYFEQTIFPKSFYKRQETKYNHIVLNTFVNEVEYVGKRQIVKIEQLATKQENNNLKHIFVAYILGREVLENSSGRTV
jgi:hypothetical protein